ncbi:hypothetical protein AYI69_g4304 [Smittium culicis]|uniref:Uncharacterized protein n=1 Tax=Smittium culicis TaxID=133412 RepID=A0A1R1YER4_9FUNG|nr:hypothetical protein AYI69_g4304 [Smittium culicis]
MGNDNLALSAPSYKDTNGTAVDFSGLPERFSGKADSISVDVWTFAFKNVCKVKKMERDNQPLVNLSPNKQEGITEFNFRFMEVLGLVVPEIVHAETVKSIYLEAILPIDSEFSWLISNEPVSSEWIIDKLLKETSKIYV